MRSAVCSRNRASHSLSECVSRQSPQKPRFNKVEILMTSISQRINKPLSSKHLVHEHRVHHSSGTIILSASAREIMRLSRFRQSQSHTFLKRSGFPLLPSAFPFAPCAGFPLAPCAGFPLENGSPEPLARGLSFCSMYGLSGLSRSLSTKNKQNTSYQKQSIAQ